jgi:type III pantothenate kinase
MTKTVDPVPAVVVDVGNSRVKWGRCLDGQVVRSVSLSADDPASWQEQVESWKLASPLYWAIAGVHPPRRDRLAEWLHQRGDRVLVVDAWQQLPVRVQVDSPEKVGIDRLLNAVAAKARLRPGLPAVVVDAGSAVTVDWLDETGAFCGGAILPGLRLMAQALRDHTALLPLVEVRRPLPPVPGPSTTAAIEAGVYWSVAGGIRALISQLASGAAVAPQIFLTGGDGPLLAPALDAGLVHWPHLTLEGIRLTAETLS